MTDASLYPFTTDVILNLLKDGFGSRFVSYYDGDPLDIPSSLLPALIVETNNGQIAAGATGTDEHTEEVTIRIVVSKMDDLGANDQEAATHKRLKTLVMGRDATTKEYLPGSVLGVLRQNYTLGQVIYNQTLRYDFQIATRDQGLITEECSLTFTVDQMIFVENRATR